MLFVLRGGGARGICLMLLQLLLFVFLSVLHLCPSISFFFVCVFVRVVVAVSMFTTWVQDN